MMACAADRRASACAGPEPGTQSPVVTARPTVVDRQNKTNGALRVRARLSSNTSSMEPPTMRFAPPSVSSVAVSTASALALAVQSPAQPAPAAAAAAPFNQAYSTSATGEVAAPQRPQRRRTTRRRRRRHRHLDRHDVGQPDPRLDRRGAQPRRRRCSADSGRRSWPTSSRPAPPDNPAKTSQTSIPGRPAPAAEPRCLDGQRPGADPRRHRRPASRAAALLSNSDVTHR